MLVQVTVVSVVARSFRRLKTNKPKFMKQCGRQASNVPEKTSFATNVSLRGQLHWARPKREM